MSHKAKPQKGLQPKLRFPAFQDAGAWEIKPLGELANRVNDRNRNSNIERVFTNSAVSGVVDQRDYFDKDIANKGNLENYFIIEQGDYVYNPRISNVAPVGPISKNKLGKGIMSPLYTVFRFKNSNNDFYVHYFKSDNWYGYIKEASNTGARFDRVSITNDQFMGLPLPHPLSEEQQKIADCLSSLDALIEAEDQKLEALQSHKKGLMQDLFPATGETLPRRRFPEFQDAGGWEERPLFNIIETVTPPKKLQTAQYAKTGLFPIIDQSQDQIAGWTNDRQAIIDKGLPLIIFGDHTCILKIVNQPFAQGADGIKIFRGSYEIETRYLHQYLQFNPLIMEEYKRHFSILKEKIIHYPKRESGEQQKIADCLSSIDDLITPQSQKLEALRDHKKGLMQQLFPSMSEGAE